MGSNSTQSKLRGQARLLRSNVIAHRTKQIQAQKKTKLRIGGIKIVKTRKKKKKNQSEQLHNIIITSGIPLCIIIIRQIGRNTLKDI